MFIEICCIKTKSLEMHPHAKWYFGTYKDKNQSWEPYLETYKDKDIAEIQNKSFFFLLSCWKVLDACAWGLETPLCTALQIDHTNT